MRNRRQTLQHGAAVAALLAAAGLWPTAARAFNKAAFDGKNLAEVVKALGGGVPLESREVTLQAPDIAENGAAVQLGMSTTLAGARQLAIIVVKNPVPLVASFQLTDAIEPNLVTRVKMSESSLVYAVALTADGKALFARKEVRVTLGGCAA